MQYILSKVRITGIIYSKRISELFVAVTEVNACDTHSCNARDNRQADFDLKSKPLDGGSMPSIQHQCAVALLAVYASRVANNMICSTVHLQLT